MNHSSCDDSLPATEPTHVWETQERESGPGHYNQYSTAMSWEADLLESGKYGT
jgi:hypothetical protein